MGGMAAQIPIKSDPEANEKAMAQVRADKLREAGDGHDGTWVAHPGLVGLAREAFESVSSGDNQLDKLREDVVVTASDLLEVPSGTRTEDGLRLNIRVGIRYLEAWIGGVGCVGGRFDDAAKLFTDLCFDDQLVEFLTLDAYELLKSF